jgi:hypothetical protein
MWRPALINGHEQTLDAEITDGSGETPCNARRCGDRSQVKPYDLRKRQLAAASIAVVRVAGNP